LKGVNQRFPVEILYWSRSIPAKRTKKVEV
jgi:hypothetical protein